jgi:hypothetical protein
LEFTGSIFLNIIACILMLIAKIRGEKSNLFRDIALRIGFFYILVATVL